MNLSSKFLTTSISSVLAIGFFAGAPSTAEALTWNDAGSTNVWSFGIPANNNWLPGNVDWVQGATATFVGTGEAISIGSGLDIGALDFTGATGTYTFTNSGFYVIDISGAGITAGGSSQVIISNGDLNFTGLGTTAGTGSNIMITGQASVNFLSTSTAGSATITIQSGNLTFDDMSSAGSATIINSGDPTNTIFFNGDSVGGSANVQNGGSIVLDFNNASTVTLNSLVNNAGGFGGDVSMGSKTLELTNGMTLGAAANQVLNFELNAPGTSGTITLLGGAFTGAGTGNVTITLQDNDAPVPTNTLGTTYTLIDWSAVNPINVSGVSLSDFVLDGATAAAIGLAGAYLEIQGGNKLVLVAVPEPATFAMPLVAALGMLWLRRRNTRVAV